MRIFLTDEETREAAAVTLHIEHLVLDGVTLPPGGAARLSVALEAELSRLMTLGGIAPALFGDGTGSSSDALTVSAPALGGSPDAMGTTLARALYGGMGSPEVSPASEKGGSGR